MDEIEKINDYSDREEQVRRMQAHGVIEEANVDILFSSFEGQDKYGNPIGELLDYLASINASLLVSLPPKANGCSDESGQEVFEDDNGDLVFLLQREYHEKFVDVDKTNALRNALDCAYAWPQLCRYVI